MQRTNLAGKLETDDTIIIGNGKSNAKSTLQRVCFNCGKNFNSEDKSATICPACKKIYNKPIIKQVTFSQHAFLGLVYFFIIGAGLAFLWFIIFVLTHCL
jgi:protein-arginine kinase activator protein McsA